MKPQPIGPENYVFDEWMQKAVEQLHREGRAQTWDAVVTLAGDDDEGVAYDVDEVVAATERALLVRFTKDGSEKWVPRSVIHDDSEVFEIEHRGRLVVKTWFVEKHNW
jgi:hypothetical protein